jgi:hypothetical protein
LKEFFLVFYTVIYFFLITVQRVNILQIKSQTLHLRSKPNFPNATTRPDGGNGFFWLEIVDGEGFLHF